MSAEANAEFATTPKQVQRMAAELADAASHPEFLDLIQSVGRAPVSDRRSVAKRVARVGEVRSREIPIPRTFRITTRTFEDPEVLSWSLDSRSAAPVVKFDGQRGSVAYKGRVVTVSGKQSVPEHTSSSLVNAEIRNGIKEIGAFVSSPAFQEVLAELAEVQEEDRPQFVIDELLNPRRRAHRNLVVPEGMLIQRSEFGDGRPTLFCVSKVLPQAYPWNKVTITIDNAKLARRTPTSHRD